MTHRSESLKFNPGAFYRAFHDETVVETRLAQLAKWKMDEIQSKRGWIGYELPNCSWSESWHPSQAVSNYGCWPDEAPGWIVQVRTHSGNNTCMLRRKAVDYMSEPEWEKLINTVDNLVNSYSSLDDSHHSEVQSEAQSKEWDETYRDEFRKELEEKFNGVLSTLQDGNRIEMKFQQMLDSDSLLDDLFDDFIRNDRRGRYDEIWNEADDGDWSCNVSEVVNGMDTGDLVNYLWPESPLQMKFNFDPQVESIVSAMLHDDLMVMVEAPLAHRIVDSLLEDSGPHSYSCVMINLPEDLANQVMAWGKLNVKDEDVFVDKKGGKGRETEPHVTVLYGLLDENPTDMLTQVFEHTAPFDIKLGACSLFRNGDYDVLKMEVLSPFLHALNRNVCSVAAHENDYPTYQPHVTIAYVKPGTCDRLEGASPWDDPVKLGVTTLGQDGVFTAKEVIYSSINGKKTAYAIGKNKLAAKAVSEATRETREETFTREHGRPPKDIHELHAWQWKLIKDFRADTDVHNVMPDFTDEEYNTWLTDRADLQSAMVGWEPQAFEACVGRPPKADGELAKWIREASQAYYRATGRIAGLREWLKETISGDEDISNFVAGSGALDTPSHVSHRTIRRLVGQHVVERVEIWKGDNWRSDGNIKIVYKENGRADSPGVVWQDEWASYEVLKWALRNWRNLYGAPLFVNGQEAGVVGYRNPALAE